jgi:transmembrane sensor
MNTPQDKASLAIREAATEWAARLSAPDLCADDRVAFASWLRASPIHVREYLNAEALRSAVAAALRGDSTDVSDLLRERPSNVVSLESNLKQVPTQIQSTHTRSRWFGLSGTALLLLVLAISLLMILSERWDRDVYATTVGEIRKIPLPDGSVVELNTRSRMEIDFEPGRRDVRLIQGEAFFTVAKDPQRPFRVLSDSVRVRAIGTQFSVYRRPEQIVVTVVEGKVAAGLEDKVLELEAGHQGIIASRAEARTPPIRTARVDAVLVTAWRQNRLIFDNQPLAVVVAEFNRYNRQQMVVHDPALAAEHISGIFDPDKPQALLLFLSRKGGVETTPVADGELLLTRRAFDQSQNDASR